MLFAATCTSRGKLDHANQPNYGRIQNSRSYGKKIVRCYYTMLACKFRLLPLNLSILASSTEFFISYDHIKG